MNRRREADVLPFPQAPEAVEVRHLRSFVAVAEELNFTRAAERLHLSRPALSRQIAHLERLVGVQLLHRTTHVVELTIAGEALLERARSLLPDRQIILSALQPPSIEPSLLEPARQLLSAGVTGMVFLTTGDCRATHAELSGRGVEFSQEPTEQPYGLDCEARDPFGNRVRIAETQPGS